MHNRPIIVHLLPVLGMILTACGSSVPPASDDGRTSQDTSAEVGVVTDSGVAVPGGAARTGDPDEVWDTSVTNVGAGLVLYVGGAETLRMACVRDGREITVDIPIFHSIASEERLSFGLDDDPHVFVAQVTPPPAVGVHATRPIEEGFLAALGTAQRISAVYGSQSIGPHAAPEPAALDVFLGACRQAMAG